jgi:2',3'-cyclic-nucleotide 2'-phosphodiesterase/3'-nucleotidase
MVDLAFETLKGRQILMFKRVHRIGLLAVWLIAVAGFAFGQERRVQITILSTTDLHGNLLPVDYYTNQPDARGLGKTATLIRQARNENPNLLLLDSGDTIQGTPLESFHNRKNNQPPDPMMLAMNALKYDAMAVGNHEYNFGLTVLSKARGEARFPFLSANTYKKGTDETYFQPYLVKEVSGVRIGILGLTTPGIPYWENPDNYAGVEFRTPLEEAKKWVPILRDKEKVDLVIVAMHMGLDEDLRTGEQSPGQIPNENMALAIAREVGGIDLILMGHTHREIPALSLASSQVLLTQASNWGRSLARVDFYLSNTATGGAKPQWRIEAKQSRTIPVDEKTVVDPEIAAIAAPYDKEAQAWLDHPIGTSERELTATDAYQRDTAIIDLVQRVQMEAGKADVSLAAPFNLKALIHKGPVTVRDIAGLYIYENTMVVLEVTGQQLKDALEHSAKFFRPYEAGKTPAELIDPKIPGYNFDVAEGVTYDIDISKPIGQRIMNLRFQGQPLALDRKLRLATNNYRAGGGGGYSMFKNAPVLDKSSREIRELIIDWVERNQTVPVEPSNNWKIVTGN